MLNLFTKTNFFTKLVKAPKINHSTIKNFFSVKSFDDDNDNKPIATTARLYRDVNLKMGKDYYDYENYEHEWGVQDDYEIIQKIGRGKYSEVYEGISVLTNSRVVIKILKPVKLKKIKREILILKHLENGPNIIKLLDVVRDQVSKTPSFIFEHFPNSDFKGLFPSLSDIEIRYYMREILKSLDFCHSKGIIHRDIKP